MGQFKPMVKMETTEPSVILKLKKGGHVSMKGKEGHGHKAMASGGMADMMGGATAAPAMARATMARRKPMGKPMGRPMLAPPPAASKMAPAAMKKGGKAEGGETKAMHKAEMSKMKGLEKELKSHESKPASKGHKGLKTGGVVNGQAGFKNGGSTGDVKLGNAGGYKKGGAAKKRYATGGAVDSGRAVAMPQGAKKPTPPVSIDRLAGTFKKGGGVKC